MPVYGDGLQVRDWLHVEDHCVAIELALKRGRSGEVYNIGGNSETTNIEIVRTLCDLTDACLAKRPDLRRRSPRRRCGRKRAGGLDRACARPAGS